MDGRERESEIDDGGVEGEVNGKILRGEKRPAWCMYIMDVMPHAWHGGQSLTAGDVRMDGLS